MAVTFNKAHLRVHIPSDAYLGFVARYLPEAASQTFVAGSPLKWTAGLLGEAASPVNAASLIVGFALEAGHNTTGASLKMIPCIPGLVVWATFLAAAAADNVLAAGDVGNLLHLLRKNANFPKASANGWYLEDDQTAAACRITHLGPHDGTLPNITQISSAAGDTNARVGFEVVAAGNGWL